MPQTQCSHWASESFRPWLTTTLYSVRTPLLRTSGRMSVLNNCAMAMNVEFSISLLCSSIPGHLM